MSRLLSLAYDFDFDNGIIDPSGGFGEAWVKRFSLGHRLPEVFSARLYGDRKRFGLEIHHDDPDWIAWQRDVCLRFYDGTQKQSVGGLVNDAGYRVMSRLDLTGLQVLEIGPGHIHHLGHWHGTPRRYVIADVRVEMLQESSAILDIARIPHLAVEVERGTALPFGDEEFDAVVSFYSLEHLHPFSPYLAEMVRVLKRGGSLVGAIPTEGGLAWGLGRYFTSRRWLKNHSEIDPDKIICWEHPNFADFLLDRLDSVLTPKYVSYWPLRLPSLDFNLVVRFIHVRR